MKKLILILLILVPFLSSAQTTNSGTEFWMGFMENLTGSGHNLRLYISSSYNAKVSIRIPGINYKDSVLVPKDSVKIVNIQPSDGQTALYDSIYNRGVHILSDFPISISAMNLRAATTDASIVLPLVNIPVAATYVVGNPNPSTNQILMVAASDSTLVSINPVNSLSQNNKRPKTSPYTIMLHRGQSYMVGSNLNLSGSVIKALSQKKLIVFSGDRCSNWPCGACDHQYEQVLPEPVLDTAYCVAPHFGHTNGYYLKVVPLDTFTNIKVNGYTYNNVSRKKPLILNVKADSGYYISSTKLFYCYQFLKGAGCNGYITTGYGDPAMLTIVSTKHFGQKVLFSTVNSTNLRDHFVSVVIKTVGKDLVYHNKVKVDSSEFKPFPYNKAYSYAMLKINDGLHELESNNGLLAYCYGIGNYESYLYLAGFSLPNFDLDFTDSVLQYDCKNQKIKMQFKAKSDKLLKSFKWYFGDGSTASGDPVSHLYSQTGEYTVKLVGEDFGGKKDSVSKKIKVNWPNFDPVRNRIICGIDTVKFEERNPFFTNFKWHDSSSKRFIKIADNANVWVTATDSSGYCRFVDSGTVGKISILSNLSVDTIDYCQRTNLFRFKDSTSILADQIEHKAWVFPWQTLWDVSDTLVHFPSAGKFKVYFDVYTTQANCKARYPMEITVHPSPTAIPKFKGQEFCANKPIQFYDSSQIKNGIIKKVQWDFDDQTTVVSDSLKTSKTLNFDPVVIRFYKHIAITNYNCKDTALNAVQVWPKPLVDFSISGDTIKCLPSARWTFTSKTTVPTDSFDLKWDAGNGSKSTAFEMRNIRYFSQGKYTVKLVATSPYGCHDSISKQIEVIGIPKAKISSSDTEQCLTGNLFTLSDASQGQHLKRVWTLGENKTDTSLLVKDLHYDSIGTKNVKLKVYTAYEGCVDSVYQNLQVLRMPKASFTINKDTQCLKGNLFQFTNTSVFYQAYKGSNWLSNLVYIDTLKDIQNYKFIDTGTHYIKLIVQDMKGCSDTVVKNVRISPQATSWLQLNDSVQCLANNRFIFTTSNDVQELKTWKLNQSVYQSNYKDSIHISLTKTGWQEMNLVLQTVDGCTDSLTKKFLVLEAPQAAFEINQDTQCFSSQGFNFENKSTSGIDNIVYTEFSNQLGRYVNQNFVNGLSFPAPGDYPVKLLVRTKENCVDSITQLVHVADEPDAEIVGDSICPGDFAFFKGVQTKGGNINDWYWDLGNGQTANTQNASRQYADPGTYQVSLLIRDENKCLRTIVKDAVLVYTLPQAGFDYSTLEYGINQMEINFFPFNTTYLQYYWNFPDGSQSSLIKPKLQIESQFKGLVTLRVVDQHGCVDSSSGFLSLFPNNFNVYLPNTITINDDLLNDVFIVQGLGEVQEFKMHIINRWGEEVFYSSDVKQGWNGMYQGKYVQEGVYSYLVTFTYFDGKKYAFRGTLTVLK